MDMHYLNTRDLCERHRCSSRTIFRKMRRNINPLPAPVIKNQGASNLWLLEEIINWEISEIRRTQSEAVSNEDKYTHAQ